jgi:hypothetical protein
MLRGGFHARYIHTTAYVVVLVEGILSGIESQITFEGLCVLRYGVTIITAEMPNAPTRHALQHA